MSAGSAAATPPRAQPEPRRLRRPAVPRALALLLAVAAVLSIAWSLATPALQGPDESAHIAATERLVEHGIVFGNSQDGLPRELLTLAAVGRLGPLIGNIDARPAWTAFDEQRWKRADARLGSDARRFVQPVVGPPTQGTSRNPPLYTAYAALAYLASYSGDIVQRIAAMRLANLPLLLVTVAACWLLAAELLPKRPAAPLIAGAVAALQPQLGFLSGTVSPDPMLTAVFSVWILLAVRLLRRGLTLRRALWLSAVAGLALLTHSRGAVLIPCTGLALLLAVRWSELGRRARALAVGGAVAVTAGGLAVYLTLASSLGISAVGGSQYAPGGFPLRTFASYLWQFYLPRLPWMAPPLGGSYGVRDVYVETFWGTFGSLEVRYPGWVYDLLTLAVAALAGGVVAVLVARRHRLRAYWRILLLLAVVALSSIGALHVVAFQQLRASPSDPIIVGRHLLVLVAPLTVAVALVLTSLRRAAPYATAVVLAGLLLLATSGLGLSLARFYG